MSRRCLPITVSAWVLAIFALGVGTSSCGDGPSKALSTSATEEPAGSSPERGSATYRDAGGETDASSDIRKVVVSSDEAALLSFKVTLAAHPDRHTTVLVYLDTDRNAATGASTALGADYQLAASELSQTDATFSLRRWNGRTFVDVSSVYPNVELRGRVVTLGFANADRIAKSFRWAVATRRRPTVTLDRAPDPGQPPLSFESGGSSAKLSVARVRLAPRRPSAGDTLTASIALKAGGHVDLMNSIEDFACSARVGPRSLEALDSSGIYGVEGAANGELRCVWRIPPAAGGKSLEGAIEVTFRRKPLSQNFSTPITP